MKALSLAKETFIRVNSRGITCIQHQIESFKGQDIYIDFLMTSEDCIGVNEDNDGEESDE